MLESIKNVLGGRPHHSAAAHPSVATAGPRPLTAERYENYDDTSATMPLPANALGGWERFRKSLAEAEQFYSHTLVLRAVALDVAQALDNFETGLQRFAAPEEGPLASTPHEYMPVPSGALMKPHLAAPAGEAAYATASSAAPPELLPVEVQLEPEVAAQLARVAPLLGPVGAPPGLGGVPEVGVEWPDDLASSRRVALPGTKAPHAHAGALFTPRTSVVQHLVEPLELYQAVLSAAKERLAWLEQHATAYDTAGQRTLPGLVRNMLPHRKHGYEAEAAYNEPAGPAMGDDGVHNDFAHEPLHQEALLAEGVRWLVSSAPRLRALAAHVLSEMRRHAGSHQVPRGLLLPLPPQLLIAPPGIFNHRPAVPGLATEGSLGSAGSVGATAPGMTVAPERLQEQRPPQTLSSAPGPVTDAAPIGGISQPTPAAAVVNVHTYVPDNGTPATILPPTGAGVAPGGGVGTAAVLAGARASNPTDSTSYPTTSTRTDDAVVESSRAESFTAPSGMTGPGAPLAAGSYLPQDLKSHKGLLRESADFHPTMEKVSGMGGAPLREDEAALQRGIEGADKYHTRGFRMVGDNDGDSAFGGAGMGTGLGTVREEQLGEGEVGGPRRGTTRATDSYAGGAIQLPAEEP